MAGLDWGAVPDYLPALTVLGGILLFFREWRREHAERREREAHEQAALELSAAVVGGTLVAPRNTSRGGTSLGLTVKNYGTLPVFDVRATVDYVGDSPLPEELRHLVREQTVLAPDDSLRVSSEYDRWPAGEFTPSEFTWEVVFRDIRGNTWRRGPRGMPVRLAKGDPALDGPAP